MYFLVVQIGRAIVRQDSTTRPSRQRFLWNSKETYDVLQYNTGTDETEGVTLHMCEMPDTLHMSNEVLNIMKNIKFLKFFQHLSDAEFNVQLMQDGFTFPPCLRLLQWDAYPLKTLPSIQYQQPRPNISSNLVELDLRYSNLERLWDKTMNLSNLRRLNVTGSKNLIELPNFSTAMKFEELIVEGCIKLQQLPGSLSGLQFFTKLNATHCDVLKGAWFPVFSREYWRISIATSRFSFDFFTYLSIEGRLYIDLLGLQGIIDSISFSSKQQNNDEMVMMEQSIRKTPTPSDSRSLQSLNIKMFKYRELNTQFRCTSFELFPSLTELKLVNLNIQNIPVNIDCLLTLETVDLSGNDFAYLPTTMKRLPKLKYLSLRNCRKITTLPHLPHVETLILSDCVSLRWLLFKDRQATNCMLELWLDNCKNVQSLSKKLSHFTRLTYLDLSKHEFEAIPASIHGLSSLGTLCLNKCKRLISVEELPLSIKHLYAHGCDSLKNVSLSPNHSIKHLDLLHCPRLNRQEHEHLMNLFLHNRHSKEGSRGCVCLPEIGVPSRFDNNEPGTFKRISLILICVILAASQLWFLISIIRNSKRFFLFG